MAEQDQEQRRRERQERDEGRRRFEFEAGARARLESAAKHRRELSTQSWREFWHDWAIRVAAIVAIVIVVALALWLFGR